MKTLTKATLISGLVLSATLTAPKLNYSAASGLSLSVNKAQAESMSERLERKRREREEKKRQKREEQLRERAKRNQERRERLEEEKKQAEADDKAQGQDFPKTEADLKKYETELKKAISEYEMALAQTLLELNNLFLFCSDTDPEIFNSQLNQLSNTLQILINTLERNRRILDRVKDELIERAKPIRSGR